MKMVIKKTLLTLLTVCIHTLHAADNKVFIVTRTAGSGTLCCIPPEDPFCAIGKLNADGKEDLHEAASMWTLNNYAVIAYAAAPTEASASSACSNLRNVLKEEHAKALLGSKESSEKPVEAQLQEIAQAASLGDDEYSLIIYDPNHTSPLQGICFHRPNNNASMSGHFIKKKPRLFAQLLVSPNAMKTNSDAHAMKQFTDIIDKIQQNYKKINSFGAAESLTREFAQDKKLAPTTCAIIDFKKLARFVTAAADHIS